MNSSTTKVPDALVPSLQLARQRFAESATDKQRAVLETKPEHVTVWVASDFVANWCCRYPAELAGLVESGQLDRPHQPGELLEPLTEALSDAADTATLDRVLRAFRNRTMVRIAWRDLARFSMVEETMAAVSDLAEVCIDATVSRHYQWLAERHGVPRDGDGVAVQMVVLGLGKLGGGELNYSSDVDLMFAYDGAGQTDGDRVLDNQEFFIKLGRRIVASLNRTDAGGFVFRTDMRLRPNGDSGPLVLPFAAMENYYQTHGRDWERYALLKARVVGGDRGAGRNLIDMLRPFVYRKYLDFSAFDAIREMKAMIERELAADRNRRDIKLGRGGIREIEFLVQNHQLIRGGRETKLQTPVLYEALASLTELGVILNADQQGLIDAYRFLRNVEHRLQMVADRQTQTLPESENEQARLAFSMGCRDWQAFKDLLDQKREYVHRLFDRTLAVGQEAEANGSLQALAASWHGDTASEATLAALGSAGFDDPQQIAGLLIQFRRGGLYRAFSVIERDRLNRLMPLALAEAGTMTEGDRALTALISIIEAIGHRSVYLSLLVENPEALRQLLQLCGASPWIARHIGQHPVVLDELLGSREEVIVSKQQVSAQLEHRLGQTDADDVEEGLNALREFYHAQVLRIAAADLRGQMDRQQVQLALTELAEVLLAKVLADALEKVALKQGPPPGEVGVIAYGTFAGGELGYHSDLDIVVCFQAAKGVSHVDAEYYFSRVGQRFVNLITTRTRAGTLFELDMRLRPSGRSGTLVTSLKAFAEYQQASAWTWEHQALVRARLVLGSQQLVDAFEDARESVLGSPRDGETLRAEITKMRDRMIDSNSKSTDALYDFKLDRGGIVDIEFLLQYLVLQHGASNPEILKPRQTLALVDVMAEAGLLDADETSTLISVWGTYLAASLRLKLMDRALLVPQEKFAEERKSVRAIWDRLLG